MGNNDAGPPQNYFALGTLFTSYWKILNCFFFVQVTNTNALSDNERAPYLDVNALPPLVSLWLLEFAVWATNRTYFSATVSILRSC